jgi:site-specific DNA-methyltransferase (adenine-specific)
MSNRLYYGDNVEILREHVADESVDLIYLDPPFNSKRDYNLLFKTPKGLPDGSERAMFPDLAMGGQTFKKAKTENKSGEQKGLF